jgi:DNA-binding MarR family transcriptional regulator
MVYCQENRSSGIPFLTVMPELEISKQIMEVVPRAMRLIRTEMRIYAKGQLTVPQFRILIKLTRHSQTHKEVAEWLGVTPATLTRIVDTLVKRKLVTREVGKNDRRLTYLSPTATGRALAEKYRERINEHLESQINALSSSEKTKLKEGLRILSLVFPDDSIQVNS